MAWSPDGTRLATAGVRWNDEGVGPRHGSQAPLPRGAYGRDVSVSWSPDGTRLATASWDRTARIWDAATGHRWSPSWPGSYTICWDMVNANGAYFAAEGGTEYCAAYTILQLPSHRERAGAAGRHRRGHPEPGPTTATAVVPGGYPDDPQFSFAFAILSGPDLKTATEHTRIARAGTVSYASTEDRYYKTQKPYQIRSTLMKSTLYQGRR